MVWEFVHAFRLSYCEITVPFHNKHDRLSSTFLEDQNQAVQTRGLPDGINRRLIEIILNLPKGLLLSEAYSNKVNGTGQNSVISVCSVREEN